MDESDESDELDELDELDEVDDLNELDEFSADTTRLRGRTGTVEQCMKRHQDCTLTGSADLHETRTDYVNSSSCRTYRSLTRGLVLGPNTWSGTRQGTGNRQGTGREQAGNRQGTGRQAGNRVVEGIA